MYIDSFLMELPQFVGHRGMTQEMFSDQGRNFVGAEVELRSLPDMFDGEPFRKELLVRDIEWHFNPP